MISSINEDILNYIKENINPKATYKDLFDLDFKTCLKYYLEWNGIIGYDKYIIALIEYCLGNLEDLDPSYND